MEVVDMIVRSSFRGVIDEWREKRKWVEVT